MTPVATLTFLDVGHGNCAILTDGAQNILIDTGPGSAVLEYLSRTEVTRLAAVVLSHADADHIKGLIAILASGVVSVDSVYVNSDALKDSELWRSLAYEIDYLERSGAIRFVRHLKEGDTVAMLDHDINLEVVAPRTRLLLTGPGATDALGRRLTSNTVSAVLVVRSAGRGVAVLPGDLDAVGLEHLLDTAHDLRADALVFPHHGGLAGTTAGALSQFAEAFVRMVEPKTIIFSVGRGLYNNPRPEVIAGVRGAAPQARIACTQLSAACAQDLPVEAPNHLLPLFASGYPKRMCCAGTIRIEFTQEAAHVGPSEESHSSFIRAHAPHAMCQMEV